MTDEPSFPSPATLDLAEKLLRTDAAYRDHVAAHADVRAALADYFLANDPTARAFPGTRNLIIGLLHLAALTRGEQTIAALERRVSTDASLRADLIRDQHLRRRLGEIANMVDAECAQKYGGHTPVEERLLGLADGRIRPPLSAAGEG